jgi:hypothetical protein
MMWKNIKIVFAFCGILLGGYLMGLSFTTKLSSPMMNNLTMITGFAIGAISILYLLIMIVNRLSR